MLDLVDIRALLDVGGPELIILLAVGALIFLVGPSKLPELARGIGRAMGEFHRGRQEVEAEIRRAMNTAPEVRPRVVPVVQAAPALASTTPSLVTLAGALGVPSEGVPEVDLRLALLRAVGLGEPSVLAPAARLLGLPTEGIGATDLRLGLIRFLMG